MHAAAAHWQGRKALGVTFLMNGGPATIYGARAFAAFREFYDQRAAGFRPPGQDQLAGHEFGVGQPDGHQHAS